MKLPDLFCPVCHRYTGAARHCTAGHARPGPWSEPGTPLWRTTPGGPLRGAPALDGAGLYVAGKDGGLYALNHDGAPRWARSLNAPLRQAPVPAAGLIVAGTEAGEVVACNASDGAPVWRAQLGAPGTGGLATADGVVYVGDALGRLHAFDAACGRPVWPQPFQARKRIGAAPVLGRGVLVVGDYAGILYGVDARRGCLLWEQDLEDRITASPVIAGAHVFAGTRDGHMAKLACTHGRPELAWTFEAGTPVLADLVVDSDRRLLSAGAGDGLYAVDTETAAVRWHFAGAGTVATAPALWSGLCFVGSNSGAVVALNSETGAELWRYDFGEPVTGLALREGILYVVGAEGAVAALPWHLGQWGAAAVWHEQRGEPDMAATYHALAGDVTPLFDRRREHYATALAAWRASHDPERAARLMEAAPYLYPPAEVAGAYQHSAQVIAPLDRRRAAVLLQRAARWFGEAEQSGAVQGCHAQASRLAALPRLRVELVTTPSLEAGEAAQIVFDVHNHGDAPTYGPVAVRLGGQLARWLKFELPPIPSGRKQEVVANELVLLGPEFRVDLDYAAADGLPLDCTQHFILDVKPMNADIVVGGDAGSVILRLEEGAPMPKVRVKGTAGMIKVQPVTKLGALNAGFSDSAASPTGARRPPPLPEEIRNP